MKPNKGEQHNERLNDAQLSELWMRNPENPINKLSLAQRGFKFSISNGANSQVVKQFLNHAR